MRIDPSKPISHTYATGQEQLAPAAKDTTKAKAVAKAALDHTPLTRPIKANANVPTTALANRIASVFAQAPKAPRR